MVADLIYVDGGFLQFGTPNLFSVAALLGEAGLNAIVVMPAYRLNVIGFLYSLELEQDAASAGETVGNHGFWDQRTALEWTKENIGLFGGNGSQITLAGYSAGILTYTVFEAMLNEKVHILLATNSLTTSTSPTPKPSSNVLVYGPTLSPCKQNPPASPKPNSTSFFLHSISPSPYLVKKGSLAFDRPH